MSAFPAELAPLIDRATIEDTAEVNGRVFRTGTLGGTRVVLGLTGIGLLNAETTTRAMLDRFDVTGVVVSAVAGSYLRIGDVAVPERWTTPGGAEYEVDTAWLERAQHLANDRAVLLERCTVPPNSTSGDLVCLLHEPAIFVGGLGSSSGFATIPVACQPNGDDVFGCDVVPGGAVGRVPFPNEVASETGSEPLAVEDMETAAIIQEVTARDLPFIAFRAVSDGQGDPLNLPGFPAQFFSYYRLAAQNAAAATIAFLEEEAGHR